jgi:hypothetical protein
VAGFVFVLWFAAAFFCKGQSRLVSTPLALALVGLLIRLLRLLCFRMTVCGRLGMVRKDYAVGGGAMGHGGFFSPAVVVGPENLNF